MCVQQQTRFGSDTFHDVAQRKKKRKSLSRLHLVGTQMYGFDHFLFVFSLALSVGFGKIDKHSLGGARMSMCKRDHNIYWFDKCGDLNVLPLCWRLVVLTSVVKSIGFEDAAVQHSTHFVVGLIKLKEITSKTTSERMKTKIIKWLSKIHGCYDSCDIRASTIWLYIRNHCTCHGSKYFVLFT